MLTAKVTVAFHPLRRLRIGIEYLEGCVRAAEPNAILKLPGILKVLRCFRDQRDAAVTYPRSLSRKVLDSPDRASVRIRIRLE